jgi:hypothetical protein
MQYRSALITGVNYRGIGSGFAEALAPHMDVLLAGRRRLDLEALVDRLREEHEMTYVTADLCEDRGRQTVITAAQTFGIDLLICNAGAARHGPFLSQQWQDEALFVELNVVALCHLLHGLIPVCIGNARKRQGRAGVIVVSSTAAHHPSPLMASYGAAKLFQNRLIEALAVELKGEPIDILAVCPSYTKTDFFSKAGLPTDHLTKPMLKPIEVARRALAALGASATSIFDIR